MTRKVITVYDMTTITASPVRGWIGAELFGLACKLMRLSAFVNSCAVYTVPEIKSPTIHVHVNYTDSPTPAELQHRINKAILREVM
jgi:hypothetical protein